MTSLRELTKSKNERTRLAAALRMADILLAHQEAEQRIAIVTERTAARKAEAAAAQGTGTPPEVSTPHQGAEERARAFLASMKTDTTEGATEND
jgi:hypothetical protein